MIANEVKRRAKYYCNLGHKRDLIWMQRWLWKGLNMIAIFVLKQTIYNCIFFSKRTKYDCNNRKFIFTRFVQNSYSRDPKTIFDIAIMFGPFWKGLQSNPFQNWFKMEIAIIFSPLYMKQIAFILDPFCDEDCNHIKSL